MRDDHSTIATTLRRLANTISLIAPDDWVPLRAHLVSVGRLCRDHELVRAAILEIRRRDGDDDERFARRELATIDRATGALERIADAMTEDGALHPATRHAIRQALEARARAMPKQSLGELLGAARARQLAPLALEEFDLLWNATEQLLDQLNQRRAGDANVDPIVTDLMTFRGAHKRAAAVIETRTVLEYRSIGRTVARLVQHAVEWDAALEPETHALPPRGQDGLAKGTLWLLERICDELDLRTTRRFALYRLRVFFEQFEHEKLRAALERPEARRKREAILHEKMDRFLFQDGYFPLTNVEASRGNIDTAIVEKVERAGVPPILVELKQVTDIHPDAPRATRTLVQAAIETARTEVQAYRGFFASRPQWAGIQPFIVVVHTSRDLVKDLETDDVILIDLSDARPSTRRKEAKAPNERDAVAKPVPSRARRKRPPHR